MKVEVGQDEDEDLIRRKWELWREVWLIWMGMGMRMWMWIWIWMEMRG